MKRIILETIILIFLLNTTTPSMYTDEIEIFSWWTAPGEIEGLIFLIQKFREENPDISVKNAAIMGGAGLKAKEILKTRMLTQNSPDSFQVHIGSELIDTWVKADYLLPIDDIWQNKMLEKYYSPQLQELVRYKKRYYALPINIHRSNLLWYNKKVFAKLNLSPPKSIKEFLEIAEKLENNGIIPLALSSKEKWPVTHIFESILADTGGQEFYQGLIEGKYKWQNEIVLESLKILNKILNYTNKNHSNLSWEQACQLLLNEKAAMTIMGSWAYGYYNSIDKKYYQNNIEVLPAFKTNNIFILVGDAFTLPVMNNNTDDVKKFLRLMTRKEIQIYTSNKWGSIPARNDIRIEQLNQFSSNNFNDFYQSTILKSIAHGSAFKDPFASTLHDQLLYFLSSQNEIETAKKIEGYSQKINF